MKTYKDGYEWGTKLTIRAEEGEIGVGAIIMMAERSARNHPFEQGKIDSCADWLHKERILNKEIARREKEKEGR